MRSNNNSHIKCICYKRKRESNVIILISKSFVTVLHSYIFKHSRQISFPKDHKPRLTTSNHIKTPLNKRYQSPFDACSLNQQKWHCSFASSHTQTRTTNTIEYYNSPNFPSACSARDKKIQRLYQAACLRLLSLDTGRQLKVRNV